MPVDTPEKPVAASLSRVPKTARPIVRYGLEFPPGTNDLQIELVCYAKRAPTGQPREYHFKRAWLMVWPNTIWNEWMDLMIWAWCNYRIICCIGAAGAGKTRTFAYAALLDYLAWPDATATTITTTKFDALRARMWGEMMGAVDGVRPELRGSLLENSKVTNTSNHLEIRSRVGADKEDERFMIQGVATDSADQTAGKIRGQHAERRRILGDEAQDIGKAIYLAIVNAMRAPDFIAVLLSNPVEKLSDFGDWCKPKGGWGTVKDTDTSWETAMEGGICLHLDALDSPNIRAGRTLYDFLPTQNYIDLIAQKFGRDSLEWWMFVRGYFPPDGTVARVWPSGTIDKATLGCVFDYPPKPVASLDPAYEHDDCVLTLGLLGRLRNGKSCCMGKRQIKIQVKEGPGLPLKDRQIADSVKKECETAGVEQENFIMDTTGNGRSVYALLFESWGPKIQKIEYGGEATNRPLRLNDRKPANEQVRFFVAELWFRASYLAADGMLCGLGNLDPKCGEDLTARRYTLRQFGERKLMVVEQKDEMKKRLQRSPDYGDSYVQFGELMARKGLLGEAIATKHTGWEHLKKLAQKATQRFTKDFEVSYGDTKK